MALSGQLAKGNSTAIRTRNAPTDLHEAETVFLGIEDRFCLMDASSKVYAEIGGGTYLDKICRIAIIVYASSIESRASTLMSKSRN